MVTDGDASRWPMVRGGIRKPGGGVAVPQPRHPDALVEAVRWAITEGAVLQAIGRARGVQRADQVRITLLAEMALPVTVEAVERWEDILLDRLTVAAAEAALAGRALPLAPADLHAVRPDLWPSVRAAELDRERVKTPHPLIKGYYKGLRGFNAQTPCRYRKPGARRWSEALLPTPAIQAALEAVVGELAAFEVLGAPQAVAAPDLLPEVVYPGPVMEPPPADLLLIGPHGRPVARIEVPAMEAVMGARAFTPGGLGPWSVLTHPPDNPLADLPHPAFLPPNTGMEWKAGHDRRKA